MASTSKFTPMHFGLLEAQRSLSRSVQRPRTTWARSATLTLHAPARKLSESGAAIALATDFNPGTSPTLNMRFVLSLACTQMKMTPAEAIVAATLNSACAVRRQERIGSIEPGKQADFAVYDLSDYREIPYFAAVNFSVATFKCGNLVWSGNESTC